MFETIKESYKYYVIECRKYRKYVKEWGWLDYEHYRWQEVHDTKLMWETELHAIEKALGLSDKEKRIGRCI